MRRIKGGLALHRGWAKLMLDRCRDLVQYPNQPSPTAAEATDEDDEDARAFYHHTRPPGYGGLAPRGEFLVLGFPAIF